MCVCVCVCVCVCMCAVCVCVSSSAVYINFLYNSMIGKCSTRSYMQCNEIAEIMLYSITFY